MEFKKHFKAYLIFLKYTGLTLFASPTDFIILYCGKILALIFGIIWVQSVFTDNRLINGFTKEDLMVYLGVYLVLDRLIQILFYRSLFFVQVYVQSGQWDKINLYPLNSAFIASFRMTDVNDVLMVIPSLIVLFIAVGNSSFIINSLSIMALIGLVLISLLIAYSILLFIAGTSFYFTKTESLYLLYRDTANIARFPGEILGSELSFIFTFIFPIFSIFALPAGFILGKLSIVHFLTLFGISIFLFVMSINFWNKATKNYVSGGG